MITINEYRSTRVNGEKVFNLTENQFKLWDCGNVLNIYTAGLGYDGPNDHNIFTVYLVGGRKFVTDWSGIQAINNENDNIQRVDEYVIVQQESGNYQLQYNDHGVRVNINQITHTAPAGQAANGNACYKVFLTNGTFFFTNQTGIDDIQNNWC